MLFQRIKIANYRTYLDLDLDLTVPEEQPLLLIGGIGGGGKTTLFEAISGALYGLRIPDRTAFLNNVNAGALVAGNASDEIRLELWFSGMILNQTKEYRLTRSWHLVDDAVRWNVTLNMDGNVYSYGSVTPDRERQQSEAIVNKIIKANLPRDLAKYFLLDAMKVGEQLSEEQLSRVIRENIENVMGLRKYLDLGNAARILQEQVAAAGIKAENERQEYMRLTEEQRHDEARLRERKDAHEDLEDQLLSLKETVDLLRESRDQEGAAQKKLKDIERQRNDLQDKERRYRSQLDEFVKEITPTLARPRLAQVFAPTIREIVAAFEEAKAAGAASQPEFAEDLVQKIWEVLAELGVDLTGVTRVQVMGHLAEISEAQEAPVNPWWWLESDELRALQDLLRAAPSNRFPLIDPLRQELSSGIAGLPQLAAQAEALTASLAGKDYGQIKRFEELGQERARCAQEVGALELQLQERAGKIETFDISASENPDPRLEPVTKLRAFLEEAAVELLKARKLRIEQSLARDLNRLLSAYEGVIDRVEIADSTRDFTFRIFHKAGNEIVLGQLNAASKQVVIQVLLKALHEAGDYDPPVMIDTVMGVLSQDIKTRILTEYFPSLSHQTILLATDSEIEPGTGFELLRKHVGKAWTLVRDLEKQKTDVRSGYFGKEVRA